MLTLRNETEATILQVLAKGAPLSRAELAREMGVTRSTVGAPTARLLDLGLLRFADPLDTDPKTAVRRFGRPGERLELTPGFCTFAAVDISFGCIKVGLTDTLGGIVAFRSRDIAPAEQTAQATMETVAELTHALIDGRDDVAGLAVSVPGVVTDNGLILRAPTLGWRDVPLTAQLRDSLPRIDRLHVSNDASLYAAAFSNRHPDRLGGNAIVVWMDAGIGGGLVANGAVINGNAGLAGEIGHMFISARDGAAMHRLEDIAGYAALMSRSRALGGSADSIESLLDEYRAGHPGTRRALQDWSRALAEGLTNLTSIMDPGVMLFSGPMAAILKELETETFAAYTSMLQYGTPPARWRIELSDDRTLVRAGAIMLRHDLFTFGEGAMGRAASGLQLA
ncbi:MAG: ROK family transcriptional regulator [Roseicyclus sp.]|jgi:predicted NBD/HSP70 family sugar kinase|nr:ROK family transcriptional regulator [Roseicyclus sp.]